MPKSKSKSISNVFRYDTAEQRAVFPEKESELSI